MTPAQATALLNLFGASLKGLAPASGGGTTNFLRADGAWAQPAAADANTQLKFLNFWGRKLSAPLIMP
jgi:hypothetical protein